MDISRRTALKALGASAVGAAAATTIGTGAADAALTKMADIYIPSIWGQKWVYRRDPVTRRYQRVKVDNVKKVYKGTSNSVLYRGLGLSDPFYWPGSSYHIVLLGHRTSGGGPMRYSHKLRGEESDLCGTYYPLRLGDPADSIFYGGFEYVVERVEVLPFNVAKYVGPYGARTLNPTWVEQYRRIYRDYPSDLPGASGGTLSIVACTKPNGLPTGVRHRIVTRARLVGPVPA